MDKTETYSYALFAYAFLITIIHIFRPFGDGYGILTDAITFITPIIPIVFGIAAVRYFGLKTMQAKGVLLLVIAIGFWLLADITWLLVGEVTVSIADVLYFIGYPLMFAGAIYGILTVKPDFFKSPKRSILVAIVCFALAFGYLLAFPLSWDPEVTPVENIVTVGYVLADLFLFVPVVMLIWVAFAGLFSRPWMLVAAGLVANFAADVLYMVYVDTYSNESFFNVGWYFAYLLFAAAFVMLRYRTEDLLKA